MDEACSACHDNVELIRYQSVGTPSGTPIPPEEMLRMNTVVNVKVEFRELGSFSYTITQAPPELKAETTVRPPYTFPKPVASQEADEIVCLPSL